MKKSRAPKNKVKGFKNESSEVDLTVYPETEPETRPEIMSPLLALWIPVGRILVKVTTQRIVTRSGIVIDQFDPRERYRNVLVVSMSDAAKGQGLEIGDYAITNDVEGFAFRIAPHVPMKEEKAVMLWIHSTGIQGKWLCNPQDYYDAVTNDTANVILK